MRNRVRILLAFVLGVALGAAALSSAQIEGAKLITSPQTTFTITTDTAGRILSSTEIKPETLTTPDVGLKVVGRHSGRVVGTLVAKIDGEWVEVQLAPQDSLLKR